MNGTECSKSTNCVLENVDFRIHFISLKHLVESLNDPSLSPPALSSSLRMADSIFDKRLVRFTKERSVGDHAANWVLDCAGIYGAGSPLHEMNTVVIDCNEYVAVFSSMATATAALSATSVKGEKVAARILINACNSYYSRTRKRFLKFSYPDCHITETHANKILECSGYKISDPKEI